MDLAYQQIGVSTGLLAFGLFITFKNEEMRMARKFGQILCVLVFASFVGCAEADKAKVEADKAATSAAAAAAAADKAADAVGDAADKAADAAGDAADKAADAVGDKK